MTDSNMLRIYGVRRRAAASYLDRALCTEPFSFTQCQSRRLKLLRTNRISGGDEMKRVQKVLAWVIILFGLRFGFISVREFENSTAPLTTGFWLLNTSLFFVVCGALNMLCGKYIATAPGIAMVTVATNVALAALVVTSGIVGGETVPSVVVGAVLLAAALGLRRTRPT